MVFLYTAFFVAFFLISNESISQPVQLRLRRLGSRFWQFMSFPLVIEAPIEGFSLVQSVICIFTPPIWPPQAAVINVTQLLQDPTNWEEARSQLRSAPLSQPDFSKILDRYSDSNWEKHMMGDLYRNEGLANMKVMSSYFRHALFVPGVVVLSPSMDWLAAVLHSPKTNSRGWIHCTWAADAWSMRESLLSVAVRVSRREKAEVSTMITRVESAVVFPRIVDCPPTPPPPNAISCRH